MPSTSYDFIISQKKNTNRYGLWRFDPTAKEPFKPVRLDEDKARIPTGYQVAQVGGYLLQWGKLSKKGTFPFRLSRFNGASRNPLGAEPVQQGNWDGDMFWHGRIDFSNPHGDKHTQFMKENVLLIPFGSFILNWIPTEGRGTYHLMNFDPGDPQVIPKNAAGPQEPWGDIQMGHTLIPVGATTMIDWEPATGNYRVFSFDPESRNPLSWPPLCQGAWYDIDEGHELIPVGDHIIDRVIEDGSYRVWRFDPTRRNPLVGPVATGVLPKELAPGTTLTGFQANRRPARVTAREPGTMDFMRDKIKHVVYYMIENRSMDHICGWLYENEAPRHFIGSNRPFDGASTDFANRWNNGKGKPQDVHLSKYKDGKPSEKYDLELLDGNDPYHEQSDVMRQLFADNVHGYQNREKPNMGGFVVNNGNPSVMETYTPAQLPVLNGLARDYAVSDEWFCSMPGGTDVNRAFSLSGSSFNMMNNFQNPPEYEFWPEQTHRPSIFKVLWANGFEDWRIYNSTTWIEKVFTYQLFLEGQIPTVDQLKEDFVRFVDDFYADCTNGTLPRFSYVEPVWCADAGSTSYHPGGDLVPGELQLKKIYDALRKGPHWEDTLLVITFDEHGGLYDHVPPPYAVKPWPNDSHDGFEFDLLGPRVPTILVSPWINERTVFRSTETTKYDSTSILATLLHWYGIPKPLWGMGDRVNQAPTFENVLQRRSARKKSPTVQRPYDKSYPRKTNGKGEGYGGDRPIHDLERLMLPRAIWSMARDKLSYRDYLEVRRDILDGPQDAATISRKMNALQARCSG